MQKPLILITNDDGVNADGIRALIDIVRPLGELLVVAPTEGQSGMSHAITVKVPLRLEKMIDEPGMRLYSCTGTPTDCVKIALNQLIDRHPTLLLSGINHGGNSSSSVLYSGTMAAAMEGCMCNIPAIGLSVTEYARHIDFSPYKEHIRSIIDRVYAHDLERGICLNVNIPEKGNGIIRVCRQAHGFWEEEFDKRTDPNGHDYYWITGSFHNEEPEAEDTDEWALGKGFTTIVPVHIDMTGYSVMEPLKKLFESGVSQPTIPKNQVK